MKIELSRSVYSSISTIGTIYVDGTFECYCLEDTTRERAGAPVSSWKIPGKTAIPAGTYTVTVSRSARFQRDLPELLDVPGFLGIRIHPGNSDADTEGCILPGRTRGKDRVGESRKAYDALFAKIKTAWIRGEQVTIRVT